MTIPAQIANVTNPFSGVFGNGEMQIFPASGTFIVPPGVSRVRVRLWGAGGTGASSPSGGGFAMRVIQLGATTSVAVTVGSNAAALGGTSSFGSFVSATGGMAGGTGAGGTGVGGDVNYTGGLGSGYGGGSAANLFGNGYAPYVSSYIGASGPFGMSGAAPVTTGSPVQPTSGIFSPSIDFIGTGGGGAPVAGVLDGLNGGGSSLSAGGARGGFPGGGGYSGGRGFVIVEY